MTLGLRHLETPPNHPAQPPRNRLHKPSSRLGRPLPSERLMEGNTVAVLVAPLRCSLSAHHFRRHISRSSRDLPIGLTLVVASHPRQTKIGHFDAPVLADQDV